MIRSCGAAYSASVCLDIWEGLWIFYNYQEQRPMQWVCRQFLLWTQASLSSRTAPHRVVRGALEQHWRTWSTRRPIALDSFWTPWTKRKSSVWFLLIFASEMLVIICQKKPTLRFRLDLSIPCHRVSCTVYAIIRTSILQRIGLNFVLLSF